MFITHKPENMVIFQGVFTVDFGELVDWGIAFNELAV
jgi:hypothetical protein